jgi:ABC-type bacteriocin/lantibiotic exporter with double-glycine peptidase domain
MRYRVMSSPRGAEAGLLVVILLLLSASPAMAGAPLGELSHVIDNVPFYPQEAYQCGPASLAAVLNFRGVDITPEDIAAEIFSREAKGTLGIDMVLYAQRKGLGAAQYAGGPDDLKRNIAEGNPVIILVDYGFWVYEKAHFMVVRGYNEDGFFVDSGKEHLKFISHDELTGIWEKAKFWTLLIGR